MSKKFSKLCFISTIISSSCCCISSVAAVYNIVLFSDVSPCFHGFSVQFVRANALVRTMRSWYFSVAVSRNIQWFKLCTIFTISGEKSVSEKYWKCVSIVHKQKSYWIKFLKRQKRDFIGIVLSNKNSSVCSIGFESIAIQGCWSEVQFFWKWKIKI